MANAGFKVFPCSTCCGCTLFQDNFTTDRLASDYTTVSGTWSVAGGVLSTSSSSGLLIADKEFPAGRTAAYVTVTMSFGSTSDVGRLILGYEDSSNYWFAEVQAGATDGTIKLYERSGGTNTQRGGTVTVPDLQVDTVATICLELTVDQIHATGKAGTSDAASVSYSPGSPPTIEATKAGIATGSVSDAIEFDTFLVGIHKDDDEDCYSCQVRLPCAACTSGDASQQMQVTITGITNQDCTDCGDFNATWVLDWANDPFGVCRWGVAHEICSSSECSISLTVTGTTVQVIIAANRGFGCGNILEFRNSGLSNIDCDFDEYSVSFFSDGSTACSTSSPTCTITAL